MTASGGGGTGDDAISGSVLALQPEALTAFLRLYGTLWSHGIVDAPTKEILRLRNARLTGCNYCKSVRFSSAREEGLTEDLVDEIVDGYENSRLEARHKAALGLADSFLRDPRGGLPEARRTELLRWFSPAEVVELTLGLALFMGFSKIAVSLGPIPELPTQIVPTPDWPPT